MQPKGGDVRMSVVQVDQSYNVLGGYIDDLGQPVPFQGVVDVKFQSPHAIVIGENLHDGGNSDREFNLYGFILMPENGPHSFTFLKWYDRDAKVWEPKDHREFYYHLDKRNGKTKGIVGTWEGQWCSSVRDDVIIQIFEIVMGLRTLDDVLAILTCSGNSNYPLRLVRETLRQKSIRIRVGHQETPNANIKITLDKPVAEENGK